MACFRDRLDAAVAAKRSCLVVGIDPVVERLPPATIAAVGGLEGPGGEGLVNPSRAAGAMALFATEVIRAVAPFAVGVKPNAAFFERFGVSGYDALEATCREARKAGVLVILDAKRGDLGNTACAYADATLGDLPGTLGPSVDATTVQPYFGEDGVRPFLDTAARQGKGVFVLVRTSNPSAAEFQGLACPEEPLYLAVARALARWDAGAGVAGAVVGATAPQEAARVREILTDTPFLVPGFGAQGAGAESVRPHFLPGGRGAVVNASRSVIFAFEERAAATWQEAVAGAARDARDELEAVRRTV